MPHESRLHGQLLSHSLSPPAESWACFQPLQTQHQLLTNNRHSWADVFLESRLKFDIRATFAYAPLWDFAQWARQLYCCYFAPSWTIVYVATTSRNQVQLLTAQQFLWDSCSSSSPSFSRKLFICTFSQIKFSNIVDASCGSLFGCLCCPCTQTPTVKHPQNSCRSPRPPQDQQNARLISCLNGCGLHSITAGYTASITVQFITLEK